MERALLSTRDGHAVIVALIPIFKPKAEGLVWGTRFFRLHSESPLEYREGLLFHVPNEFTAQPDAEIPTQIRASDPLSGEAGSADGQGA